MTIRSLFDPSKDIYRTIEKVITYGASQEGRPVSYTHLTLPTSDLV